MKKNKFSAEKEELVTLLKFLRRYLLAFSKGGFKPHHFQQRLTNLLVSEFTSDPREWSGGVAKPDAVVFLMMRRYDEKIAYTRGVPMSNHYEDSCDLVYDRCNQVLSWLDACVEQSPPNALVALLAHLDFVFGVSPTCAGDGYLTGFPEDICEVLLRMGRRADQERNSMAVKLARADIDALAREAEAA